MKQNRVFEEHTKNKLILNTILLSVMMASLLFLIWLCFRIMNTASQEQLSSLIKKYKTYVYVASILNLIFSIFFLFYVLKFMFVTPVAFELMAVSFNLSVSIILLYWSKHKTDQLLTTKVKENICQITIYYLTQFFIIFMYLGTRWYYLTIY